MKMTMTAIFACCLSIAATGQNLPATVGQPLLASVAATPEHAEAAQADLLVVPMTPTTVAPTPGAATTLAPMATLEAQPAPQPGAVPYPRLIMNISMGASWTMADLNSAPGGDKAILWGFYFSPTVVVVPHLGARFDVAQDYDTHSGQQELRYLRVAAGPVVDYPFAFLHRTYTPFVYAEGGATRISKPDSYVTQEAWRSATIDAGIGLRLPICRRVGIEVIPAEFSTYKLDNGQWLRNFSSKAGVVFNFYGPR